MSASATPITPELFAIAIKDLPVSALHYKALELRNSIAHLDYSNQQLLPYTDGTSGEPDPDCVDAIKENEVVIERFNERLGLLRIEVEARGLNWREFSSTQELEEQDNDTERETGGDMVDATGNLVNGHGSDHGTSTAIPGTNGTTESRTVAAGNETVSSPWTDGTFTTGTINNGNVAFDSQPLVINRLPPQIIETRNITRQFRTDSELQQAMMERMDEDTEDGDGVHL